MRYATSSNSTEGRLAIVTDAGRDAVDAKALLTNSARCGRQKRVVLTPRRRRQAPGKQASRGVTVTKKPIAGRRPRALAKGTHRVARCRAKAHGCARSSIASWRMSARRSWMPALLRTADSKRSSRHVRPCQKVTSEIAAPARRPNCRKTDINKTATWVTLWG
jgi:hypothetical protein